MFNYKYEVTNVGTAPAKDVEIEARPAPGLAPFATKPSTSEEEKSPVNWKLGELAPGATKTVEYSVMGPKPGTYVNKAAVTGAGGLREAVEHEVRIGLPKLTVTVVGPSQRGILRDATFHITVKNVGDVPALDLHLSDSPIKHVKKKDPKAGTPVAEEKVSDSVVRLRPSDGGTIEGNVARWSLRTLPPGASQTVSIVLRAKETGELTYSCHVRSRGELLEQGKTLTRFVEPLPLEIDLQRIGSSPTVKVGTEVSYTLRLRNGDSEENTNVDVVLSVPKGLELIEPRPPVGSQPSGGDIRLIPVTRLDARSGMTTLRFRATKPGDAKISLKAVSTQTGPDKPARLEESVTVTE